MAAHLDFGHAVEASGQSTISGDLQFFLHAWSGNCRFPAGDTFWFGEMLARDQTLLDLNAYGDLLDWQRQTLRTQHLFFQRFLSTVVETYFPDEAAEDIWIKVDKEADLSKLDETRLPLLYNPQA
jgi:hypothetical protein